MNRLEFGRLIAMLRQEMGLTREKLAAYTECDVSTINNLERGAKKHIDPDILLALANVFELTSLERREFFLAACGLEQSLLVRQPGPKTPTTVFDINRTLANAYERLAQLGAPGYLVDPFGNLIAANAMMIELMQFDLGQVPEAFSDVSDGFLAFRFIYSILERQSTFDPGGYNQMALTLMRAFREVSLRYRATPRYQALVREFRNISNYPLFERYWRKAASAETDKESMMDMFELDHTVYGRLRCLSSSSVTITPYGELFLTHTMPVDKHTALTFIDIADKVGRQVVRITPWPRN